MPTSLFSMPTLPQERPDPLPLTVQNRNQAIRCLDLTSLSGDDTAERIKKLCEKALKPCDADITVAAVCVFPVFVKLAKGILKDSGVKVATVAAGFPHGLSTLKSRLEEIRQCVEVGADEIDVVIRRSYILEGRAWDLIEEVRAMRGKAGDACLKIILGVGDLKTQENVFDAASASIKGGADFIKSSTGKDGDQATFEAGEAMCAAIKGQRRQIGLKISGGLKTPQDAMAWLALAQDRLGDDWTSPRLFRIGASTLLDKLAKAPTVD